MFVSVRVDLRVLWYMCSDGVHTSVFNAFNHCIVLNSTSTHVHYSLQLECSCNYLI